MAKGDWWFKFEINIWMNDPTNRGLSRANRDSWLTAICLMRINGVAELSGEPDVLANMLSLTIEEFDAFIRDLERTKAANVTKSHTNVTILSRRLAKELNIKEDNRLRKQREREAKDVTEMSEASLNKSEVISNKKEKKEELNAESASASPSEPEIKKPVRKKPEPDPRKDHPAIKAVLNAMSRYPLKDLWDKIIRELGDNPDPVFIQCCYETWRGVNGSPNNLEKWLFEPNRTGKLPEIFGAQNGKNNGYNGSNERTDQDVARESEEFIKKKFNIT
jgi:hypothetical protein